MAAVERNGITVPGLENEEVLRTWWHLTENQQRDLVREYELLVSGGFGGIWLGLDKQTGKLQFMFNRWQRNQAWLERGGELGERTGEFEVVRSVAASVERVTVSVQELVKTDPEKGVDLEGVNLRWKYWATMIDRAKVEFGPTPAVLWIYFLDEVDILLYQKYKELQFNLYASGYLPYKGIKKKVLAKVGDVFPEVRESLFEVEVVGENKKQIRVVKRGGEVEDLGRGIHRKFENIRMGRNIIRSWSCGCLERVSWKGDSHFSIACGKPKPDCRVYRFAIYESAKLGIGKESLVEYSDE